MLVAKVTTPHPLRGSSPQGEPLGFYFYYKIIFKPYLKGVFV